jgi:hypothetical protein
MIGEMNHSKPRLHGLCVLMLGLTFAGGAWGQVPQNDDNPDLPPFVRASRWERDGDRNVYKKRISRIVPDQGHWLEVQRLDSGKYIVAIKKPGQKVVQSEPLDNEAAVTAHVADKASEYSDLLTKDVFSASQVRREPNRPVKPKVVASTYMEIISNVWERGTDRTQGAYSEVTLDTKPKVWVRYIPKDNGQWPYQITVGSNQPTRTQTYGQAREEIIREFERNPELKKQLDSLRNEFSTKMPELRSQGAERRIKDNLERLKAESQAASITLAHQPDGYTASADSVAAQEDRVRAELQLKADLKRAQASIQDILGCEWQSAPPKQLFVSTCNSSTLCTGLAFCRVELGKDNGEKGDTALIGVELGCTAPKMGECPSAPDCMRQEGTMVVGDRAMDFGEVPEGPTGAPPTDAIRQRVLQGVPAL